jgi:hypothetical protein
MPAKPVDPPARIESWHPASHPAFLTARIPLQCLPDAEDFTMSEDAFNMSIRKFLKEVGVTSQRKIEETVRDGQIRGKKLKVRMTLTAEGIGLNHVVDGEIELP